MTNEEKLMDLYRHKGYTDGQARAAARQMIVDVTRELELQLSEAKAALIGEANKSEVFEKAARRYENELKDAKRLIEQVRWAWHMALSDGIDITPKSQQRIQDALSGKSLKFCEAEIHPAPVKCGVALPCPKHG